jgi:aminoglycoside phosphotransferase (APT) family kinase protein
VNGLDLGRLTRWFDTELPGLRAKELHAHLLTGGRSNLTYVVEDGVRRWVLRRPPLGHVLSTAHDMGREFRVQDALRQTGVRVPAMLGLCTDSAVIGTPFYVMEHVEGTVYSDVRQLHEIGPSRAARLGERLVDTLAVLHQVDPDAVGLVNLGRPDGFLARQVHRWSAQLDASRSRPLAGVDELRARLAADVPETERVALVHGDYRLDNVLIDADDQVAALLDWEMATLGDPLTDLALLAIYQRIQELQSVTAGVEPRAPGWPSEAQLVARYVEATGREVHDLGFHLALAAFKATVIIEGIHYRHVNGLTVGPGFDGLGELVEPLITLGLDSLEEQS